MQDFDYNIADILNETPRKRVEFDLSRVDIGALTIMELFDAADAAHIPFDSFRENLFDTNSQAYLFYAIAWVIMRRQDKSLTFDEVCDFDLIITGEIDEDAIDRNVQRAKGVVAVAAVAGVSPQEAAGMTVAEVSAAVDLAQERVRRTRRGRKR